MAATLQISRVSDTETLEFVRAMCTFDSRDELLCGEKNTAKEKSK